MLSGLIPPALITRDIKLIFSFFALFLTFGFTVGSDNISARLFPVNVLVLSLKSSPGLVAFNLFLSSCACADVPAIAEDAACVIGGTAGIAAGATVFEDISSVRYPADSCCFLSFIACGDVPIMAGIVFNPYDGYVLSDTFCDMLFVVSCAIPIG